MRLHAVSQYVFAHGKTSSGKRLQAETYDQIRGAYGLPAQMACNVPRQVGATYKGLWTKVKKNTEARKPGYTKKRYKGLDKPPKFVSPTLTYNYHRDDSLKENQQVSILTLQGRIIVPYQGYSRHVVLLQDGATIGAAKLWYDCVKKRFYLLIALEIAPRTPRQHSLGRYWAWMWGSGILPSSPPPIAQFYSGKEERSKADHYARLHKRLQRKGTRSATRKLVAISGRERRLKLNTNHVTSKRIIDTHPQVLLGLEKLNGIRERTKRRKGNKLVPVTQRARTANLHASKWAFTELHSFLAYKAVRAGALCVKVEAAYTSQQCPRCGFTSPDNRPHKGLLFVCQNPLCHYTLHADLVGARNVARRKPKGTAACRASGETSESVVA